MTTYVFEARNAKGEEIKDEIEAQTEDEAHSLIRQQGYSMVKKFLHIKKLTFQIMAFLMKKDILNQETNAL